MGIKSKRVNADRTVNNLGSRFIKNEDWVSLSSSTYMTTAQIVAITGASGSYVTASKAQADVALDISQLWIAKQDIWEFGEVARWAHLTAVDTSGSSIGDPVYLSDTAGAWTLTIPATAVIIGKVLVVSATIGEVSIDLTTVKSGGGASDFGATGISADVVAESTAAAGVTVDGVLLKDGGIVMADGAAIDADTVNEATAAAGVTIDGLLVKDGVIEPATQSSLTSIDFVDDFLADVGGTIPTPWVKDTQTANITGDYVSGVGAGVYRLLTDSTSEAQAANLTWGDALHINMSSNPIVEFRVKLNMAGAALTADERVVVGLGSAHANGEDALDSVTTNAWFRIEGASLNILVETDDGSTDTNDQDSTIDMVDDTWMVLKIDASALADVKFYVDGVEQGGAAMDMSALGANTYVQPIVCIQRDAGTEVNNLDIDYIRVIVDR